MEVQPGQPKPAFYLAVLLVIVGLGGYGLWRYGGIGPQSQEGQISQDELHMRSLIVEGILSIQAGDNPRVVQEKLITFVPPSLRVDADEAKNANAEKAAA